MSDVPEPITLVGVYGSPFTRRVAISLQVVGIAYHHRPLGIFRDAEEFARLNPLLRAPVMLFGDADVLTESDYMLDAIDEMAGERRLTPAHGAARRHALQTLSIAKSGLEKAAMYFVEGSMRPEALHHAPMIDRAKHQTLTALSMLEQRLPSELPDAQSLTQVHITSTVLVGFVQGIDAALWDAKATPRLAALATFCETLPPFLNTLPS